VTGRVTPAYRVLLIHSCVHNSVLFCNYLKHESIAVDSRSHSRVGKVMAPLFANDLNYQKRHNSLAEGGAVVGILLPS
jgi:hypothetical protein